MLTKLIKEGWQIVLNLETRRGESVMALTAYHALTGKTVNLYAPTELGVATLVTKMWAVDGGAA